MSQTALPPNAADLNWLLVSVGLVMALIVPHLSPWIGAFIALFFLWRYVIERNGWHLPSLWILLPVVVLAVPLIDTVMVVVVRLKQRRPVYVGDRLHLSHRLVAHGLSPRGAVVFLYLATFFLGLGAVTLAHADLKVSVLVLVQSLGAVGLLLWLVFDRKEPS